MFNALNFGDYQRNAALMKLGLLLGVGEDAEYIAHHISRRQDGRQ